MKNRSAGFTLIELLTVMAIISILMVILVPRVIEAQDKAKVVGCQANMKSIYDLLVLFNDRSELDRIHKEEPGVRYFLKVWKYDVCEHTESAAKKFICPAVKVGSLPGLQGKKYENWFDDWEGLDGTYTSYAGRDIKTYPTKNWQSGKIPLVSDDNDGEMNHRNITNVLMGDGTVKQIDMAVLKAEGLIGKEETNVKVGPESPDEILKQFIQD